MRFSRRQFADGLSHGFSLRQRLRGGQSRPAFRDDAAKQPFCEGRGHQHGGSIAPADSPNSVTFCGSPPNCAMLLMYPPKRGDLVQQSTIA